MTNSTEPAGNNELPAPVRFLAGVCQWLLGVESQQVVHGETESTDGCLMFNAAMGSMEVVSMCPACEAVGPLV